METRKHIHEETFAADPETVFSLLVTPSAIRQWWGATHAIVDKKEGGIWVGVWGDEDAPDFITFNRMRVYDPPNRVMFAEFEYYARTGGLPFANQLTAEFTVIPEGPNRTSCASCRTVFRATKRSMIFTRPASAAGAIPTRGSDDTFRHTNPGNSASVRRTPLSRHRMAGRPCGHYD